MERIEYYKKQVASFVLLGDVFALRPENLNLPMTLCLLRWKNPLSVGDMEFKLVMRKFDYVDDEINWILYSWIPKQGKIKAIDFVNACVKGGITAEHRRRLTDTDDAGSVDNEESAVLDQEEASDVPESV